MTIDLDDIPDLPDTPPPVRVTIDGDTGEIILSPLEEVTRATAIVAQQGAIAVQIAADTSGYDVAKASPDARAALVDFYLVLSGVADQLAARAKAIEYAWQAAMRELGADRLPLPDGRVVEITQPPTTYAVDAQALHADLAEFVRAGLVSAEDAAAAVEVVVTYKPDHRVINKLSTHAPSDVRESIATHRSKVPPMSGGRVRFPKPRAERRLDP